MELRQVAGGVGAALVGPGGAALYASLNPTIEIGSRLVLYYGGLAAMISGALIFAWLLFTRPNPVAYLLDINFTLNTHRTPGELQGVVTITNTGPVSIHVQNTGITLDINGQQSDRQRCDPVTLRAGIAGYYHIDLGAEALAVERGEIGVAIDAMFGRPGKRPSRAINKRMKCPYSVKPFRFQNLLVSEDERPARRL